MDRPNRAPKPKPAPGPCNNNCGKVSKEGSRISEITCPCGFGYYDRIKHEFVPGALVRDGKAPSREEYVAHVRQCRLQQEGFPVIGTIFLGSHTEHDGFMTFDQESRRHTPSQQSSQPDPPDQGRGGLTPDRHGSLSEPRSTDRRSHPTVSSAPEKEIIFIPKERIELEVLAFYLNLCNYGALEPRKKVMVGDSASRILQH